MDLNSLVRAFRLGTPIVLFDSPAREAEADLVLHASFATPDKIRLLRKEAGGLVCLAVGAGTAKTLSLPFACDLVARSPSPLLRKLAISKTPYGDKPAFSLFINHRKTFTGISDIDRSKTIIGFCDLLKEPKSTQAKKFVRNFYSPGHVPLLISRGIRNRRGHTELAVALCEAAGLSPAAVLCEMLGDDWKALSWGEAGRWAEKNGCPLVDGPALLGLLGAGPQARDRKSPKSAIVAFAGRR